MSCQSRRFDQLDALPLDVAVAPNPPNCTGEFATAMALANAQRPSSCPSARSNALPSLPIAPISNSGQCQHRCRHSLTHTQTQIQKTDSRQKAHTQTQTQTTTPRRTDMLHSAYQDVHRFEESHLPVVLQPKFDCKSRLDCSEVGVLEVHSCLPLG